MDENDDQPHRLHPEDLSALARAMREGPVRTPDRDRDDSGDMFNGRDARYLEAIVRERIAQFLTAEQIEGRIDRIVGERLASIGLRVDEQHIEETGDAVRSALKWHKRLDKVIGGMIIAALGALIGALLKAAGFAIPGITTPPSNP